MRTVINNIKNISKRRLEVFDVSNPIFYLVCMDLMFAGRVIVFCTLLIALKGLINRRECLKYDMRLFKCVC